MAQYDVFTVGASVGGVEAVTELVSCLPADFPGALFIVIHTAAGSPGMLPSLLARRANLIVKMANDFDEVKPGTVYVAPPDHHMILEDGHVRLSRGPTENRHRPALDPLFRSAARAYDSRVVGVVLTGYLDDGTAGLMFIKRAGGLAVVQDPNDAVAPGMPKSALEHVKADYTLPLAEIPALLDRLARQGRARTDRTGTEMAKSKAELTDEDEREAGKPSPYVCPSCKGTLWEVEENGLLRFKCRVGHMYSAESMFDEQNEEVERALWAALKALEENAEFANRLAARAREANYNLSAGQYKKRSEAAKVNADVLRRVLGGGRRVTERAEEPDSSERIAS